MATKAYVAFWACLIMSNTSDGWQQWLWLGFALMALIADRASTKSEKWERMLRG